MHAGSCGQHQYQARQQQIPHGGPRRQLTVDPQHGRGNVADGRPRAARIRSDDNDGAQQLAQLSICRHSTLACMARSRRTCQPDAAGVQSVSCRQALPLCLPCMHAVHAPRSCCVHTCSTLTMTMVVVRLSSAALMTNVSAASRHARLARCSAVTQLASRLNPPWLSTTCESSGRMHAGSGSGTAAVGAGSSRHPATDGDTACIRVGATRIACAQRRS